MIEQKAIYESAQTAFEAHHPKFPFPKKNNLDEQSDKFKKAFLVFSADINAMHEREIESIAGRNNELLTAIANTRSSNRHLLENINSAKASRNIAWLAVIVLFVAMVALKLNS